MAKKTKGTAGNASTTNPTMQVKDDAIRDRAYQIWEAEQRPEGKEMEHWLRAEAEVRGASEAPKPAVKQTLSASRKAGSRSGSASIQAKSKA